MVESARKREIQLYMGKAQRTLEAAQHNLDAGFYDTAVNRSYYAVFYAASALLLTKGITRKKHSGVISAFRQHFVKQGLIDTTYSDSYGRLLTHREIGDYEISTTITPELAKSDLEDAEQLVRDAISRLEKEGWI